MAHYTPSDHSFAVCAYKENPYLEQTIESLEAQWTKSRVFVSTSTPNDYIRDICERHGLPLTVNPAPHLAGDDWNWAYDAAETPLVTIVHQDDIYDPTFLTETLRALNARKHADALIAFTDYWELRDGERVYKNRLLGLKRAMLAPLGLPGGANARWLRRRILAFGDPICCPAVTFNKELCGPAVFDTSMVNSCDYKTWVDLSAHKGAFVYIPQQLMGHRIYAESATTANLASNVRQQEDAQIFASLWPAWIARRVAHAYEKSGESNEV